MFGLGLGELFFFAAIALIVLGPEKLPTAIRSVIRWTHQLKKLINNVQTDIERELEITQIRQKVSAELSSFKLIEEQMQNQLNQIQKEMEQIEKNQLDNQTPNNTGNNPGDSATNSAGSHAERNTSQTDILKINAPLLASQNQPPQTDPVWLVAEGLSRESLSSPFHDTERLNKGSEVSRKPAVELSAPATQATQATQATADHLRAETL